MKIGIPLVLVGILMIVLVMPIEILRVIYNFGANLPPIVGTVEYILFFGGMFFFSIGVAFTIFEVILSAIERHVEHKARVASLKTH
jgi:hypothetical protein